MIHSVAFVHSVIEIGIWYFVDIDDVDICCIFHSYWLLLLFVVVHYCDDDTLMYLMIFVLRWFVMPYVVNSIIVIYYCSMHWVLRCRWPVLMLMLLMMLESIVIIYCSLPVFLLSGDVIPFCCCVQTVQWLLLLCPFIFYCYCCVIRWYCWWWCLIVDDYWCDVYYCCSLWCWYCCIHWYYYISLLWHDASDPIVYSHCIVMTDIDDLPLLLPFWNGDKFWLLLKWQISDGVLYAVILHSVMLCYCLDTLLLWW